MPQQPNTKQFCFALCTVKCDLVYQWVTQANPHFFMNEIFELWDCHDLAKIPVLYPINCREACLLCSVGKVFTLYSSRKNVSMLTVIQTSTDPHKSEQLSCTTKRLLCGFVIFWGQKEYPWTFPSKKTPKSLKTFISPSHYLLQCYTYCFKRRLIWKCRLERV